MTQEVNNLLAPSQLLARYRARRLISDTFDVNDEVCERNSTESFLTYFDVNDVTLLGPFPNQEMHK